MSTLKVLKEYLVGDDGYLLSDDNNAKTVMLSGTCGNEKWLQTIWKYGYQLFYFKNISKEEYEKITNFIETDILLHQDTRL